MVVNFLIPTFSTGVSDRKADGQWNESKDGDPDHILGEGGKEAGDHEHNRADQEAFFDANGVTDCTNHHVIMVADKVQTV